jgi:hypothetical protein
MTFNQGGNEPFGTYYVDEPTQQFSGKRPRAPFEFLIVGLFLSIALLVLRIFGPPSWSLDLVVGASFWVGSLIVFLFPFAIFSEINLARQLNPDYRSNKQSAKTAVFSFVIFGFLASLVHMLYVSSLLARLFNVD